MYADPAVDRAMLRYDDHTLICMLFDLVASLSARLYPNEQPYASRTADVPSWTSNMPTGMFDVFWSREPEVN